MRNFIIMFFCLSMTSCFGADYTLELYCQDLNVVLHKIEVHGFNIANKNTSRTKIGGPFKRKIVTSCKFGICKVAEDHSPPIHTYDPSHPDADKNGYVAYPSFSTVDEMAKLMKAQSAYEIIMSNRPFDTLNQLVGRRLDSCFKKYSYFKKHFELKSYLGR